MHTKQIPHVYVSISRSASPITMMGNENASGDRPSQICPLLTLKGHEHADLMAMVEEKKRSNISHPLISLVNAIMKSSAESSQLSAIGISI